MQWFSSLKGPIARARIRRRIVRLEEGNLGDAKAVGQGVFELRLVFGPGFRIYFGEENSCLVILLCGGDKSTQQADINRAHNLWAEYKESK